jgi:tetratricopeptide (TPR) repeat protein
VVIDYLGLLLVPTPQTAGLYNDTYTVSQGLFVPPSTAISLVLLAAALVAALVWRRRQPVFSLAILFFLAAHLMESTFLPLELYFEHRNYLPAAFLFLAVAYYGVKGISRISRVIAGGLVLLMLLYAGLSYARVQLWSDFALMSLVWVEENPDSVRTRQQAAIFWESHGDPERALEHILAASRSNPDAAVLPLQALALKCKLDQVVESDVEAAVEALANRYSRSVYDNLDRLATMTSSGGCAGLGTDQLLDLVTKAKAGVGAAGEAGLLQDLHYLQGRVLLESGRTEEAVGAFRAGLRIAPSVDLAMQMTAILATHSQYSEALRFLNKAAEALQLGEAKSVASSLRTMAHDYPAEIARLRRQIQQDMEASGPSP